MTNLIDLITKLQAAKEGSRELDGEISIALNGIRETPYARITSQFREDHPLPPGQHWIFIDPKVAFSAYWVPYRSEHFTDTEGLGLAFEEAKRRWPDRDFYITYCAIRENYNAGVVGWTEESNPDDAHPIPALAAWIAILTAVKES